MILSPFLVRLLVMYAATTGAASAEKKPLSVVRTLATARRDLETQAIFPPPMITDDSGGCKHEKTDYINIITELLERCNDMALLDLICKLLYKSI